MTRYSSNEILEFAAAIEATGEKFYRQAEERVEHPEVRKLFHHLATEEVKHERLFKDLLGQVADYEPREQYPEEYFNYLQAVVDRAVFTDEQLEAHVAKIKDARTAVDFAMQKEQDTILFYMEIREFVPEDSRSLVDSIIQEERTHYLALAELGGKLD